jgi:hypothetical protein
MVLMKISKYRRESEFIRRPCPYRTVPYRTVPYRTVPYRTVPYRTVPYRTVPYRTVPYRTVPYRTVPFSARDRFGRPHSVPYFFDRFPRGTVLVDRAAYRTFLTVFRDFCLKAGTLPRFKFYRSSILTLIFRKSANRTVPKH